jgi:hypothetical protein
MSEIRNSLAQVQELLAVMPSQELTVYDANEGDGWPPRPLWSLKNAAYDANAEDDCVQLSLNFGHKNDADALAACFNFLRTHGPALLAMMEDHSPDAGKMGEDSARLDYIERTFSGMTNRERYLPVTMIWGTGANGRTLREACDKYMAKDAARAGERG